VSRIPSSSSTISSGFGRVVIAVVRGFYTGSATGFR
jgi:hypothetical protein